MWNFKPTEKNPFPIHIINNNLKYINRYRILTPSIIESFLDNDTFPGIYELYHRIPNWVIKTDLGRLLIIYFNGGIYSDADCFILQEINQHKEYHNIILFTEHICKSMDELGIRECKNSDNLLRISNYFFGSISLKHPFIKEVINECLNRLKQILIIEDKTNLDSDDILWVCGPDVITTVFHTSKTKYNDIFLYDETYLDHRCDNSWK